MRLQELIPAIPTWTLPGLWPQLIQAPVPPQDQRSAGRSRPRQPVIPVHATDILPTGIAVIDYSRIWTAVLSGIQGVHREILIGRLNEIFETIKASGKNYVRTGLSPPENNGRSYDQSVVSSNIQVVSGRNSYILADAGIVWASLFGQERVAGFVLVSSPVEHSFGTEENRPAHLQQARNLIRSLNITSGSRVVTVGPGEYSIGWVTGRLLNPSGFRGNNCSWMRVPNW